MDYYNFPSESTLIQKVNMINFYRAANIRMLTRVLVILYSLSTSLVLLCSLKTQDYVLLLSTFITEYHVLLLWLSQSLSPSLSPSHAVRTSFKYGALYRHAHILTHHLSYINTCAYTMSHTCWLQIEYFAIKSSMFHYHNN